MELNIDFSRILKYLLKRWWLIALVTIAALAAGFIFTPTPQPDVYSAEVSLVGVTIGPYDSTDSTNIIRKNSALVNSEKVALRVKQALPQYNLTISAIQSSVEASYNASLDSALFYVTAESADLWQAIDVANAAAEAFVSELKNISGTNNAIIVDKASRASVVFDGAENQIETRAVFAGVGFILTCIILTVVELFNPRVMRISQCTLNGSIDLLGVVPKYKSTR